MTGWRILTLVALAMLLAVPTADAKPGKLSLAEARSEALHKTREAVKGKNVKPPRSVICRRDSLRRFTCRTTARGEDTYFRYRCDLTVKAGIKRAWVTKRKCGKTARPYLTDERAYEALWLHVNGNQTSWKEIGPLDRISRTEVTSYYVWHVWLGRFDTEECWTPITAVLVRGEILVTRGVPDKPECSPELEP